MANILVIDHIQTQRVELMNIFGKLGHTVTEAWDGSNAAHKADQITYDMIIASIDITKIAIVHFIKSLRLGKMNRVTPVILYGKNFDEGVVASLGKFGRIQFITLPIDGPALSAKITGTFNAAEAVVREQNVKKKVYTFSKASLEKCNRVPSDTVERDFFRFFPDMLLQIDPLTVDFGIWLKGTNDLLEYVGPKFSGVENDKNVADISSALKRANVGLEIYVRIADKEKFYAHVQKKRLAHLASKNLQDSHREAAEIFNKLTMCASRFNAADIDQNIVTSAEQISMDMMQRLNDKPDLMTLLIDLLRKDQGMYDFIALVTITAVSIGRKLGLKEVVLKKLSLGCFFHDVGMGVLKLPLIVDREMTPDEANLYKDHPSAGADHLNLLEVKGITLPEEVFIIMMQHHEKFNGTGFPNQKQGRMSKENPTGIHLLAAIVAVADRFALYLLNESQNGAVDQNRIVTAMHRITGEFDPAVLKAFKEVFATSRQGIVNWKPT
jgi:response regulator RpfG family c-di-GMP phosphodiesterase